MNAKNFLNKRSDSEIKAFFKMMLNMVEDMKQDHDFHYQKLYDGIPELYHQIIDTANHFTEEKINWIRKRILDHGNECLRNIKSEMENCEIKFIFK